MTDRASELTLILQSSATRIVVHGSLLRRLVTGDSAARYRASRRRRRQLADRWANGCIFEQAFPASAIVFNLKRLLHLFQGAWRACLTHIDRGNAVHLVSERGNAATIERLKTGHVR